MKKLAKIATAALAAAGAASAAWVYEGKWGSEGSGNGQFNWPQGIAVAPNGNVYVAEYRNNRVQYFGATGSFLGKWRIPWPYGVAYGIAVGPAGLVYVTSGGLPDAGYVGAFTSSGSLIRTWVAGTGEYASADGVDVGVYRRVYVAEMYQARVAYYNGEGKRVGWWRLYYGDGLGAAPSGNVYVTVSGESQDGVLYFTPNGSLLGSWGSRGTGNAQFNEPRGVEVAPDGTVFVADRYNNRIQYFTPAGSFLGKWGRRGEGVGEFYYPFDVAVSPDGRRVYVVEAANDRVQYFRWTEPAVTPTSLGRVKALFR